MSMVGFTNSRVSKVAYINSIAMCIQDALAFRISVNVKPYPPSELRRRCIQTLEAVGCHQYHYLSVCVCVCVCVVCVIIW